MSANMDNLSKAKARMLVKHVFFSVILLSTKLVPSERNDTAWTDGRQIGFNPKFIASIDIAHIIFVLAHEVMHIALQHALRRGSRHPLLWNYACDYAINLMLDNSGVKMPCGPDGKPLYLIDKKYAGMSAEQIYELLKQEVDKERKKRGLGSIEDAVVIVFGDGGGLAGDIKEIENLDPETRSEIERQVMQKVGQAANMARMAGKLSGDLERLVGDMLEPQVPWQQLLMQYALQVVHDEESWSRRNRRFQMYLPDKHNVKLEEVAFIGDTSGSISEGELKKGATESYAVYDQVRPQRLRLLWADTEVKNEQVFEQGDAFAPEPKGGGGTDMRVPLAYVEQYNPSVVILMTDGHTPWPDREPEYPLIVLCTTNAKVPIGNVIRI